ncbi:Concanavalin A-like lectin/glucanase [Beauveria brongniartii RCEF 3172]|uniref:Concanavalin A-like lectin/glucanase n=1 Tax=Beauveria brongniartii RCEF 3172 TaxID=1081107 RepID=A0A167ALE8_9HYPO|nr:Concanavalin A-like lectin/glucanase [Beauveria brongniartii RCEF 3172]
MLFKNLGFWLLAPSAAASAVDAPNGRHVRRDRSSGNWCGQVLHGNIFRDVSSAWVMPKSWPLPAQYSAQPIYNYQWVGIDGASDQCQAILQAGTYARVRARVVCVSNRDNKMQNNVLTYGFWYEFYPKDSWLMTEPVGKHGPQLFASRLRLTVALQVNPGDSVFVQVKAYNSTSGYAYMKNLSTGKDITIPMDAPDGYSLCGSTAEWIQEDASASGTSGLAPFNTFSFEYCSASDAYGYNYNLEGSEKWYMHPLNSDKICYPSNVSGGSVQINYSGPTA